MPNMAKKKAEKSSNDSTRYSRDGDQFHYFWAARQCLELLDSNSELVAVSIEGASLKESQKTNMVADEIIDVGKYFGSEELTKASRIEYIQLKHSTRAPNKIFLPSDYKKTFKKWAEKYREIKKQCSNIDEKVIFRFVSNRPMHEGIVEAIQKIGEGKPFTEKDKSGKTNIGKIWSYISPNKKKCSQKELREFCKLIRLEGKVPSLIDQRGYFNQEIGKYLPGSDGDATRDLKALVDRKATSEGTNKPTIDKLDVLRVLRTPEEALFPAPNQAESLSKWVRRDQESEIYEKIVSANHPVIIHASGGTGKSVFANTIQVECDSVKIVYDCFGNGDYHARHQYKDGLVQIANELATAGYCDLLIPNKATNTDYMLAFLSRLRQAISIVQKENKNALLWIIIDAADNAQMAAKERQETHSFAWDLIREQVPEGVRFVFLTRTHRQDLLSPPPEVIRIELNPFSKSEVVSFLSRHYPNAGEREMEQVFTLSTNPLILSHHVPTCDSANALVLRLAGYGEEGDLSIETFLKSEIKKIKYKEISDRSQSNVDTLCRALSLLRPRIPISDLSKISEISEAEIETFANHPTLNLQITDGVIQFRDETTETFFREEYRPSTEEFNEFLEKIEPLTNDSFYLSALLPQLMLNAGKLDELIEMAFSGDALPSNPSERREIELQRFNFAIKACLRKERYLDATKLAFLAGGESAGYDRQLSLFKENTDLVGRFFDPEFIYNLNNKHPIESEWMGLKYVYAASFLSAAGLNSNADIKIALADKWLENWNRQDPQDREEITHEDIVEIALAALRIQGAEACVSEIERWKGREENDTQDSHFTISRKIVERLIDNGDYSTVNDFLEAAENNLAISLAIILELFTVHRLPTREFVESVIEKLRVSQITFDLEYSAYGRKYLRSQNGISIAALNALLCVAIPLKFESDLLIEIAQRYLPNSPPRRLSSFIDGVQSPIVVTYAILAYLKREEISADDLMPEELKRKSSEERISKEVRGFRKSFKAILAWPSLGVLTHESKVPSFSSRLLNAIKLSKDASDTISNTSKRKHFCEAVAELWMDVLISYEEVTKEDFDEFERWSRELNPPMDTHILTSILRKAAHSENKIVRGLVKSFAPMLIERLDPVLDSDSIPQDLILLCRAILSFNPEEAKEYFDLAIEKASSIGNENIDRWKAILAITKSMNDEVEPSLVYAFARSAELTRENIVRDKYYPDWSSVEALSKLNKSSAFAILSRWRDREFGDSSEIEIAVEFLVEEKKIDPLLALLLTKFRFDNSNWNVSQLLGSACSVCDEKEKQQAMFDSVYRDFVLDEHFDEAWIAFQNVAVKFDLIVSGEFEKRRRLSCLRKENSSFRNSKKPYDYRPIFDGINLYSSEGINTALQRFSNFEDPLSLDEFFKAMVERIDSREALFIKKFRESGGDRYNIGKFLEILPESWKNQMSVRTEIQELVRQTFKRYCLQIHGNEHWANPLKISNIVAASGLEDETLAEIVLNALGRITEDFDTDRLFTMIGLLTMKLDQAESKEALKFGLGLFSPFWAEVGDGDWSKRLLPPKDLNKAVGGYIWSCLGSPESGLRWEAAHVVRALFEYQQNAVLEHLVQFAEGEDASVFGDSRFKFYELYARQWLLIGLARAAIDFPESVSVYKGFLLSSLEMEHLVIREFAKRALLSLINFNPRFVDEEQIEKIKEVNTSSILHASETDENIMENEENTENLFSVINPISDHFESLNRLFESEKNFPVLVTKVIREDLDHSSDIHWNSDTRHNQKRYEGSKTSYYRNPYPATDNLVNYLAYNGMMIVGARLLDTTPLKPISESIDGWLRSHTIESNFGKWRADFRSAVPVVQFEPIKKLDLEVIDFETVLRSVQDGICVSGFWTRSIRIEESAAFCNEEVYINSALISGGDPTALLNTSHPRYLLPILESEERQDRGRLTKRWLTKNNDEENEFEKRDPWATTEFPEIRFSNETIELMKVSRRDDSNWYVAEKKIGELTLWSTKDDAEIVSNNRFMVKADFIQSFLELTQSDLVVEIQIRRDVGEKQKSEKKLFLVRKTGEIIEVEE